MNVSALYASLSRVFVSAVTGQLPADRLLVARDVVAVLQMCDVATHLVEVARRRAEREQ